MTITGWVLTVLLGLALFASATFKFMPPDEKTKAEMEKAGLTVQKAQVIGVVEIVCTILFLIPPTSILGAVLLTGYFGGATFAHVAGNQPVFVPILFGVLAWLAVFLRHAKLRTLLPWRY
jgi:uncharacterized membrane protein YphA (DoxX/SURF4 family)